MSPITITKENFEQQVLQCEKPVLVEFWGGGCAPCRMVAPIVEEIAEDMKTIRVGKIDVDEQAELALRYRITSIPTFMVFKNGEVCATTVGLCGKEEILNLLEE